MNSRLNLSEDLGIYNKGSLLLLLYLQTLILVATQLNSTARIRSSPDRTNKYPVPSANDSKYS